MLAFYEGGNKQINICFPSINLSTPEILKYCKTFTQLTSHHSAPSNQ